MGVPAVFARISRCSLQWGVFTAAASVLLGAPDGQGGRHVLVEGDLTVTIETAAAEPLPRFDQTAVVRSVTCHGREWLEGPGLADEFGLEGFGVLGFTDASLGGPIHGVRPLFVDLTGGGPIHGGQAAVC